MKSVYLYLCCTALTIGLSLLFPGFHLEESAANALYTITGIMFSIGLSLTVISSTAGVRNKDIKKRIRMDIKNTRNHFILTFLLASATYIMYLVTPPLSWSFLNRSWGMLILQGVSIVYFVYNFIAIQKFHEQIEDSTSDN